MEALTDRCLDPYVVTSVMEKVASMMSNPLGTLKVARIVVMSQGWSLFLSGDFIEDES
jgi:hypothetical protein